MLGSLPHRSLQHLAKRYGSIMSIHLGNVPVIVVSSPKVAELFLKTHDHNFANWPKTKVSQCMTYGAKDLAFVEYGPYWRHVWKFCTTELICPSKVRAFALL
ncbi:putative oxidoreductase [Rosa chinensis]|uniref:Putative oxidoreductase n=1 Tax=Rosa chinensis TaxID=74649 RepID=A0A2P6QX89_ROSCH|nr:putative oxidoreductase [Rosa chinensis]